MKQFNPCKVTERRKKLQKTQSDVAKEAGLSLASLSYIETGKKIPKANTLIRLADALKCSVDTGDITIVLYLTEVLYEKQRDKGCRPVAQSHSRTKFAPDVRDTCLDISLKPFVFKEHFMGVLQNLPRFLSFPQLINIGSAIFDINIIIKHLCSQ